MFCKFYRINYHLTLFKRIIPLMINKITLINAMVTIILTILVIILSIVTISDLFYNLTITNIIASITLLLILITRFISNQLNNLLYGFIMNTSYLKLADIEINKEQGIIINEVTKYTVIRCICTVKSLACIRGIITTNKALLKEIEDYTNKNHITIMEYSHYYFIIKYHRILEWFKLYPDSKLTNDEFKLKYQAILNLDIQD